MTKQDCNTFDKDSPCYVGSYSGQPSINRDLSEISTGRNVTIKPTINFVYNEEIERIECDEIETDINGKPIAKGCKIQFRDDEVIKRILSPEAIAFFSANDSKPLYFRRLRTVNNYFL